MSFEKQTHSDSEVLVRVEGVSKKFCRSLKKSLWYGLCDIAGELSPFAKHGAGSMEQRASSAAEGGTNQLVTRHPSHVTPAAAARDEDLRDGEFYAVRDVSFELRRGECLGLIGHNGAGKTTLLKMLNGLIKPDAGKITMRGRVGALIALGAGFNPILTGRENIYINGSVLGLSRKEIDGKIDEIIDFAEIGEFIDMPVMNYSSGMNVRLGFAVAANLINPDILLLDEVLAVGDDQFRLKCLDRVGKLLSSGVAGILVTHQMMNVERTCTRCNVMAQGRTVLATGDVQEAIRTYLSHGEPVGSGDVEIIEGPDSALVVKVARYDEASGAVRVDYESKDVDPTQLLVTYRVLLAGNELMQGSSRNEQNLVVSSLARALFVRIPGELRRLGELRLYLGIYEANSRKPLVLIKDLLVPSDRSQSYRLELSTHLESAGIGAEISR